MNKARRKQIEKIIEQLEVLREGIETVMEEEQEYFDNMPENLQGSERGEKSEECIGFLEYADENIQEGIDNLTESTQV